MRILTFILANLIAVSCSATGPQKTTAKASNIPVSISTVETNRVGDSLVRVIRHNMEIHPVVEFERLLPPEMKRAETLVISELPMKSETLKLSGGGGTFIEELLFKDEVIEITFEYYYLRGGAALIRCVLPVSAGFGTFSCSKQVGSH